MARTLGSGSQRASPSWLHNFARNSCLTSAERKFSKQEETQFQNPKSAHCHHYIRGSQGAGPCGTCPCGSTAKSPISTKESDSQTGQAVVRRLRLRAVTALLPGEQLGKVEFSPWGLFDLPQRVPVSRSACEAAEPPPRLSRSHGASAAPSRLEALGSRGQRGLEYKKARLTGRSPSGSNGRRPEPIRQS